MRRHSSEFLIGSREHYSVKPITKRALDYEIDSTRPTDRIYIHARTHSLSLSTPRNLPSDELFEREQWDEPYPYPHPPTRLAIFFPSFFLPALIGD